MTHTAQTTVTTHAAATVAAARGPAGGEPPDDSIAFAGVFHAELSDIKERHNRTGRALIDKTDIEPTTALGLTGIACSGGGIRSASFCLGVLQGLQGKNVIRNMDYLSTVSGGGYIGTMMTIGMSCQPARHGSDGTFPFGRLNETREPPEVRHLRDNSRYLVKNGLPSVVSALVIYLRGITMNVLVLVPILFLAAAVLVSINPDTFELTENRFLGIDLTGWFADSRAPFTLAVACAIAVLLVIYAILVSIFHIVPLAARQRIATIAAIILALAGVVVVVELHALLLRFAFESRGLIVYPPDVAQPGVSTGAALFGFIFGTVKKFVVLVMPVVVAILPFLKRLAGKAVEGDADSGWGDLMKRIGSRVVLIIAGAVVPLLLWLTMMQLAYWGTGVSSCPTDDPHVLAYVTNCKEFTDIWTHAPGWATWLFGLSHYVFGSFVPIWAQVPLAYGLVAAAALILWPFLSVNANSLHQLYRDRLGSAFLVRRQNAAADEVTLADEFKLTDIKPKQAPYHLINTALNVPGSPFANRRGRNADFFVFSRRYIGSEATGYVDTATAEKVVDGLNIGTAMAISGAAAAPNMGMASIRPLSPTIALLNVRLGRWVRHPRDIAKRNAKRRDKWKKKHHGKPAAENKGEAHLSRIPGPRYLLREAFAKSGATVTARDVERKDNGFVFLTDGGHIDNLGIYELLRRRCRLIVAIDGEADPDLDAGSLVQVERFARIDMNIVIRMDWEPIGTRTRAVDAEIRRNRLRIKHGPHIAVGRIDYPPLPADPTKAETGVLIYVKASMSGDEIDYVVDYKTRFPAFPHESTADQMFSEEQLEAYRALGEHIARRFADGSDAGSAFADDHTTLLPILREVFPDAALAAA